jgi:hypothetical protein
MTAMPKAPRRKKNLLDGTRVYLSGPMDFVASRAAEEKYGWRNRVGEFLGAMGVTIFDPWHKPKVRGLFEYGREGVDTDKTRAEWSYADGDAAAARRAGLSGHFWETMHIDLRMVDTSDFVVSYCPTNVYSVGTPHEIILCRQQHKPVLFVSPRVTFPSLTALQAHLKTKRDRAGARLLGKVVNEVPIKDNPDGIPSLWYMPLVGGERFFDGFGFAAYRERFSWKRIPLDKHEEELEVQRPLLPYLERLSKSLPKKWDNRMKRWVRDDDWLFWELGRPGPGRSHAGG